MNTNGFGSWEIHDSITNEDINVLNEALNGFCGAGYEPLLVATQIVNGINYMFIAKSTSTTNPPHTSLVKMYIHKPIAGDAIIVNIEKIV